MIFSISSEDNFGEPVKVETKDLDFSAGFQIDGAQLSGLSIEGNEFNFMAKKINPINGNLPIISSDNIIGTITFFPDTLIKIKAERAEFNTKNNLMNLKGELKLENEVFKLIGSSITIDFGKNIINSNKRIKMILPNSEIEAGKIHVINVDQKDENLKFLLDDGVRLKYLL